MSHKILKDCFDAYTTDSEQVFYIPRLKSIKNNICCGYDMDLDSITKLYSYKKCKNNVENTFVCEKHKNIKIEFSNSKKINTWQLFQEDAIEFKQETFYVDRLLNSIISNKRYNPKCNCVEHLLELHRFKCKCKREYYKTFDKCVINYYVDSSSLVLKYFDKNKKLIFKGIVYDNIELSRTKYIMSIIHNKKFLSEKMISFELLDLINKEKSKVLLKENTNICEDVINKIIDMTFYENEVSVIQNYLLYFDSIKSEINLAEKATFIINLINNIVYNHKIMFSNKKFSIVFKNKIKDVVTDIKKNKVECDMDKLNVAIFYMDKLIEE
jgi:hypothetical protein